jgi:hypothetical protein
MWWVLFALGKCNPLVQTYELEVDNRFNKSWLIKKYFDV